MSELMIQSQAQLKPDSLYQDFERCFHSYKNAVFAVVLAIIGNRTEAEEVTQEVFLAYLTHLKKGQGVQSTAEFLFRIARNRAIDYSRKEKRRGELLHEAFRLSYKDQHRAEFQDEELLQKLNRAIDLLPREQKEVLVLKVYAQRTFREIADICGIPLKTASSRFDYALDKLRKEMAGE